MRCENPILEIGRVTAHKTPFRSPASEVVVPMVIHESIRLQVWRNCRTTETMFKSLDLILFIRLMNRLIHASRPERENEKVFPRYVVSLITPSWFHVV